MNTPWQELLAEAPWLVTLLAKTTVLLAGAWVAHLALRGGNPRWRVLLWRATAVGLVALPLLTLALPAVRLEVAAEPSGAALVARAPSDAASPTVGNLRAPWRFGQAWPWLPAALWAVGLAVVTARTLAGHRQVGRLARLSRPVPEATARAFGAIAAALGCRTAVEFRTVAGIGSPLLIQCRRPVVMLPDDVLAGADRCDLEGIVAHELAHVCSGDLAWAYALHWLAAALWFHPLAWGMGRAHSQACELVSDAVSADYVGSSHTYARTLARVVVSMKALQPAPAGLPLAGRTELGGRLAALHRGVAAGRLPLVWRLAAWAAGGAFLVVLSALVVACSTTRTPATAGPAAPRPVAAGPLEQRVTLAPPYPSSYPGAPTDRISVQYAVINLAGQAGLRYDWPTSYANTDPVCRRWVRPDVRDVPAKDAMRSLLEPVGLTYRVKDGTIVLARRSDGEPK